MDDNWKKEAYDVLREDIMRYRKYIDLQIKSGFTNMYTEINAFLDELVFTIGSLENPLDK